jgi:GxxExxY protein
MEAPSAEFIHKLTESIIGAGIEVHRKYGPGLLESAYGPPLDKALDARGLAVEKQKRLPPLAARAGPGRYRLDFVVEQLVVVEIKAVERLLPVHAAQLRTYLRLTGCPVGLILNFNTAVLKDGIKRVVNNFPE